MHVIGGWSDWVASLQIISRNLQAVGIDASVKIEPDWPAWVSNSAISGTKPSLIWSNGGGDPTPYAFFFSHFDPSQVVPTGQDARRSVTSSATPTPRPRSSCASSRGRSTGRSSCRLRTSCRRSSSNELPYIPLFIGPRWSTYSRKFFKGWVTWQNQYADPIFSTQQQVQISLLSLYYADSKKKLSVPALPNATAS